MISEAAQNFFVASIIESNMRSLSSIWNASVLRPENKAWKFVILAIFVSCSIISVLTPPFQSPDEYDHVKRAYLLSKGTFVLDAPADQVESGGMVDAGLVTYMNLFARYSYMLQPRLSKEDLELASSIKWSGERIFSPAPGTGYYFPLIYSPQALGLAVGEAAGLSVNQSYKAARLLTLCTIALVLLSAFRLYAPSAFVGALLVVPMTLYQMSSLSLDGISNAVTVLAISAFLRISLDKERTRPTLLWLLGMCVFLLASSRVHLLPMLILIFASFFYTRNRLALIIGVAVSFMVMVWLYIAVSTTVDARVSLGLSTSELLKYYIARPFLFLEVIWNTFNDPIMLNHWLNSFIGLLGWLDAPLGLAAYGRIWWLLGIVLVFSMSFRGITQHWPARALLLVCSIGSMAMMFLALLIAWTPHPATIIQGVQGRYFLMPVLFMAYALYAGSGSPAAVNNGHRSTGRFDIRKWLVPFSLVSRAAAWAVLAVLFVYSAISTTTAVLTRYYLPLESTYVTSLGNMSAPNHNYGELTSGRVFQQSFVADNAQIHFIRLFLATYARENSGEVTVEILNDEGRSMFRSRVGASSVVDNGWHSISTGTLAVTKGERYTLRLTSKDGTTGNAITWWAVNSDAYPEGHATVDSVEQAADFNFEIVSTP